MTNQWCDWEDWLGGLYRPDYSPTHVAQSVALLGDPDHFREVAREMLREWPKAARHNIGHLWTGRNAWVGQASCLYAHKAPAVATREAWAELSLKARAEANGVATDVRVEWEQAGHARQALFDL